jgi:zinc transport system permease protein
MLIFDDFIIRVFVAGILLGIISGPIGSLVMWQKKAYFGDSLAHSAILGIAVSLFFSINSNLAILLILTVFALLLFIIENKSDIPSDTILGVMAHSSVGFGIVLLSLKEGINFDLEAILFGDILAVSKYDLIYLCASSLVILIIIKIFWQKFILISLSNSLAQAEYGKKIYVIKLIFIFMLTIFIGLNVKIVGILVINAMLLISAVTAKQISKSPLQMAFWGSLICCFAVILGMYSSYFLDIPIGASIVCCLAITSLLVSSIKIIYKNR